LLLCKEGGGNRTRTISCSGGEAEEKVVPELNGLLIWLRAGGKKTGREILLEGDPWGRGEKGRS